MIGTRRANTIDPVTRRVLPTLCATQITGWGVLYYAFPVLIGPITHDTGWSPIMTTAAFSGGQLVAAFVGIPVGRLLDQRGPRTTMTVGSALAVLAVLLMAAAPDLATFTTAWSLAGIAMGAVLYPPAFAALTRWHRPHHLRALTTLTLVAGLAGTVFAPLTALLTSHLHWRHTYLVLAVILAVITVPAHWWGLRAPWPPSAPHEQDADDTPTAIIRGRSFVALGAVLSIAALTIFAAVTTLVPLLTARGISPTTAAVALGLGSAGQLAGRLAYPALHRASTVTARGAWTLVAVALTTALLGVLTSTTALIAAAVLAGVARGVFTLIHATAVTDRWGSTHYGRLNGLLSAPVTIVTAVAPFVGTVLAGLLGGHGPAFLALAAITLLATPLVLIRPTSERTHHRQHDRDS